MKDDDGEPGARFAQLLGLGNKGLFREEEEEEGDRMGWVEDSQAAS